MKLKIIETLGPGYYHIVELEDPINNGQDLWYFDDYKDTDEWCKQTFGLHDMWGAPPVTGWKRMRNRYYFVDAGKLSWFVMRWE
jgi:hypothetical protein